MNIDLNNAFFAVMGVGMGVHWFYSGFRELKLSRTIQNTPTSRIATGAVGTNVEIHGEIFDQGDEWVQAPISGKACAFYSVEIQKLVRRKNSRHWVKIDQFFSVPEFHLDDGSGAYARVVVKGANIKWKKGSLQKLKLRSSEMSSMPANLMLALTQNAHQLKSFKIKQGSWWNSKEYRFLERCFLPGEKIYAIGFADSGLKLPKKEKLKFQNFLQAKKMIEANPEEYSRFDTNDDGVFDEGELERGATRLGNQLEQETRVIQAVEKTPEIKMVLMKRKPYPFIISNIPEKDLMKSISLLATLKVWGGPVATLAGAAYLLYIFSGQLSFPF